ncbi:hypothetical protein NUW58_g1100 [Xylaria curta]|uniref:Uncharacterized protein n=1 Tax=Xylaria curta TaxID=42375 RepID=A0ACC1PLW4_9PEZI|nr:hypothetical protein NUW58_g1100 [Xylaria curta]
MDSNKTLRRLLPQAAALCSTSLGTTFSVLQASGLSHTRLGAVLASAALLDDVVGLVMRNQIFCLNLQELCTEEILLTLNAQVEPATILRPVLVSVAFAVAVLLACRCVLQPGQKALDSVMQRWNNKEKTSRKARAAFWIRSQEAGFLSQTALLILLVVAADYAGTSVLLAAYLAGVVVSWWDGQRDDPRVYSQPQSIGTQHDETRVSSSQYSQEPARREHVSTGDGASADTLDQETPTSRRMASRVFEEYYAQSVNRILKPFFFASIGFSIPISQLFVGGIVFRGIIYSVLMIIGKLVCGLWLVRFSISMSDTLRSVASFISSKYRQTVSKIRTWGFKPKAKSTAVHEPQPHESPTAQTTGTELSTQLASRPRSVEPIALRPPTPELATPPKPLSLYPAAVMGCAMVARGEIGFLISSTAESQGIFRRPDEIASKASGLFLIVTWAIFVCTIIGPVCTGLLVRRIQKLERAAEASRSGTRDVLGVWGVG